MVGHWHIPADAYVPDDNDDEVTIPEAAKCDEQPRYSGPTPVQELRAAASKIRESAKDANQAKWCAEYAHWAIRHVERNVSIDDLDHPEWHDKGDGCEGFGMYAGRYIALWHPGVAELVAKMLDVVAHDMDENPDIPSYGWDEALNLARLINGEA